MDRKHKLRFVSWNLGACILTGPEGDSAPDPEGGLRYVRQCLQNLQPDIAGFQEVLFRKRVPSQAAQLAEMLGYPHLEERALSASHVIPGAEMGLSILSRYPLGDTRYLSLPNPQAKNTAGETSHEKGILACKVAHPEQSFWFLCAHFLPFHRFEIDLESSDAKRIFRQADEVFDSFSDLPMVCSVDFNAILSERELPKSLGSNRLRPLIFQPTRPAGEQHDQILCSKHFLIDGARVYQTRMDHFVALAELELTDSDRRPEGGQRRPDSPTKILHLSDLHFGERSAEDVDWKTFISTAEHETRKDRLDAFLSAAAKGCDYVVISGDFTIAGREDGFEAAGETLRSLSESGTLPPLDRVVIVPGNHDVQRDDGVGGSRASGKKRWDPFINHLGRSCVRPFMPSHDPSLAATLADLEVSLEDGTPIWGGFARRNAATGGERRTTPFPFLFDRERGILLYAFNSASISGSKIVIPEGVEGAADFVRKWKDPDADKARSVLGALEDELSIDPARIQPGESALFQGVMGILSKRAGQELDDSLKIAVLHHHLVPLPLEEVKKFEFLTNAGGLLHDLSEEGFHVCLHGHKHFPALRRASAILDRHPMLVVSGGTIGGGEAQGKEPGFFLLEYEPSERSLGASFVELEARGNPEKLVAAAPRLGVVRAHEGGGTRDVPAPRPWFRLQERLEASQRGLLRYLRKATDDLAGELTGWSHSLDEDRVSTIATSYGLRILHLTGATTPFARSTAAAAARTLLAIRNPQDGGWSASSQMTESSQPEPTAFVLLGLRHWLTPSELDDATGALEDLLDDDCYWGQGIHTFSLALLIRTLSAVAPASPSLGPLVGLLLGAAYRNGQGEPVSWPSYSTVNAGHSLGASGTAPTLVHSAMAVLALEKVHHQTGGRLGLPPQELLPAARWLLHQGEWSDVTEDINRPQGQRYCNLVVKHFTSTWVLRALLATLPSFDDPRLLGSIRSLADSSEDGLWNWGAVARPVWATHDALSTLKAFILNRRSIL